MVEVVKCTCAVEDRILLQDVDVKFASGQMCGIMGPSGCGKTTLLNAIVHGELLTSGSFIEINGTDVRSRNTADTAVLARRRRRVE